MKNTYLAGLFAEWVARQFLRVHGFKITKTRYITGRNTGRAEIDIIARKRNLILFVEVKNRPDIISGLDAISYTQHHRLRSAAEVYLRRNLVMLPARFDLVIVTGLKIKWIKNFV